MTKHTYFCENCGFKTDSAEAISNHYGPCADRTREQEHDLLGDWYWKLDMLREDARVPSELLELLYDMGLAIRRK